jgi:hypothetical protein
VHASLTLHPTCTRTIGKTSVRTLCEPRGDQILGRTQTNAKLDRTTFTNRPHKCIITLRVSIYILEELLPYPEFYAVLRHQHQEPIAIRRRHENPTRSLQRRAIFLCRSTNPSKRHMQRSESSTYATLSTSSSLRSQQTGLLPFAEHCRHRATISTLCCLPLHPSRAILEDFVEMRS